MCLFGAWFGFHLGEEEVVELGMGEFEFLVRLCGSHVVFCWIVGWELGVEY